VIKALGIFALIILAGLVVGSMAFERYETMAMAYASAKESLIDARRQVSTASHRVAELETLLAHQEAEVKQLEALLLKEQLENSQLRGQVVYLSGEKIQLEQANEQLTSLALAYQMDGYREFGSRTELVRWLIADDVSNRKYKRDTYDCDDFAIDLAKAGVKDNRWIGLWLEGNHLRNFTIIGNTIVEIEPQNDGDKTWGKVD